MWHVSNEYGHTNCRCELCLQAFREWLQLRYGSLEELNKAWWATFWSHRYTDWSQVEPVDPSVHGLMLDWMRFVSDQVLDFYLAETRPLREITPRYSGHNKFHAAKCWVGLLGFCAPCGCNLLG